MRANFPASRTRRSKAEWQALINDCEQSDLSPQQFCEQRQLSYHRFSIWQRRLSRNTFDGTFVELAHDVTSPTNWVIELTVGDLTLKLNR